jgi:hypothetical protein
MYVCIDVSTLTEAQLKFGCRPAVADMIICRNFCIFLNTSFVLPVNRRRIIFLNKQFGAEEWSKIEKM